MSPLSTVISLRSNILKKVVVVNNKLRDHNFPVILDMILYLIVYAYLQLLGASVGVFISPAKHSIPSSVFSKAIASVAIIVIIFCFTPCFIVSLSAWLLLNKCKLFIVLQKRKPRKTFLVSKIILTVLVIDCTHPNSINIAFSGETIKQISQLVYTGKDLPDSKPVTTKAESQELTFVTASLKDDYISSGIYRYVIKLSYEFRRVKKSKSPLLAEYERQKLNW